MKVHGSDKSINIHSFLILTPPTLSFWSQHTSTLQHYFILIVCYLSLQLHQSSSNGLPMAWSFCSQRYINLRLRSSKESSRDRIQRQPHKCLQNPILSTLCLQISPFPSLQTPQSNGYGSLWFFINWNIHKFLPTSHKAPVIASPRSSEEKNCSKHLLWHKNITQPTFPSETPFAKNNDRSVIWATKSAEQTCFPLLIKTTGNSL